MDEKYEVFVTIGTNNALVVKRSGSARLVAWARDKSTAEKIVAALNNPIELPKDRPHFLKIYTVSDDTWVYDSRNTSGDHVCVARSKAAAQRIATALNHVEAYRS